MHDKVINIGNRTIGVESPPFIVAELSGNHNQSLERALLLVDAAAAAGAHAVKLQTYRADTMTLDLDTDSFRITDPASLWHGRKLYDLYDEAHTPWDWHKPIFDRTRERGMVPFSTPFDATAVDFLESLDVPCYKIASFENTDLPLIRRVARSGKPVLISTGMATADELDETVSAVRSEGCEEIMLLKCTSAYPAEVADANLRTIPDIKKRWNVQVGLSDHTLGLAVPLASVALGATLIEKHFTLARSEGGVDAAFSIEPHELKDLVEQSRHAWSALGRVSYELTEKEIASRRFRRSLYVVADMKEGEAFTIANVQAIRPGDGLPPADCDEILGCRATRDIARGTPLNWDLVER